MRNTGYEDMNPELRKEVARDSVKKTTLLRVLIAALLIFLVFRFQLRGVAAVVLIAVAILVLLTMIPVWIVMNKNMKEEEPSETE